MSCTGSFSLPPSARRDRTRRPRPGKRLDAVAVAVAVAAPRTMHRPCAWPPIQRKSQPTHTCVTPASRVTHAGITAPRAVRAPRTICHADRCYLSGGQVRDKCGVFRPCPWGHAALSLGTDPPCPWGHIRDTDTALAIAGEVQGLGWGSGGACKGLQRVFEGVDRRPRRFHPDAKFC